MKPGPKGPSQEVIAAVVDMCHAKDSLWSVDLFRCESAVLHTY
jgi:hypothetical protein